MARRFRRLLWVSLAATSCGPPGVVVEVYNHTPEALTVHETYNDASSKSARVEPGGREEFGPAVSWHVSLAGRVFELQHPGDEFAESRGFGQQLFHFQVDAPGCLFVLRPEQRAPTGDLPAQPRGYPLGPSSACSPAPAR